ncbi:hypothetical protein HDV02_005564 [Globomyces sp. JEL0801]|nr:hypothetical protein HDV02_005564 [Globomyces sp. JEL0801]
MKRIGKKRKASPISQQSDLYRIKLITHLKEYSNQQARIATKLNDLTIECDSVQDFKSKLWNAFSTHLQKAAIIEEDNITISDEEPTVDDIDKYISFKRHNRFLKPSRLTTLFLHTITSANESLVTSIFKHSESLSSKDHFIRYNRIILMPEIQDRSGAAADELIRENILMPEIQDRSGVVADELIRENILMPEIQDRSGAVADELIRENILMPEIQDRSGAATDELIREIIVKLREAHQHNYVSAAVHWRIWASYIVSKPIPTHEGMIMSPPPSHIIHLFDNIPNVSQQRLTSLNNTMVVARDIVEHLRAKLNQLKETKNILVSRIDSLEDTLNAFGGIIPGLINITRPDTLGDNIERRIPDQKDEDHDEYY